MLKRNRAISVEMFPQVVELVRHVTLDTNVPGRDDQASEISNQEELGHEGTKVTKVVWKVLRDLVPFVAREIQDVVSMACS